MLDTVTVNLNGVTLTITPYISGQFVRVVRRGRGARLPIGTTVSMEFTAQELKAPRQVLKTIRDDFGVTFNEDQMLQLIQLLAMARRSL